MPATLPYLASYKNVGALFERIQHARVPEAFTQSFLHGTLGLKSAGDRKLIPFLRTLGFLDPSGRPTAAYSELKNDKTRAKAIAAAIKKAYKPLFDSNENTHKLTQEELKGLIGQVGGTDKMTTTKTLGPLNALMKIADFAQPEGEPDAGDESEAEAEAEEGKEKPKTGKKPATIPPVMLGAMRTDFHFNIQVHLPANATEEAYLSIFTALRKAFS